jgi:hypothetical protein
MDTPRALAPATLSLLRAIMAPSKATIDAAVRELVDAPDRDFEPSWHAFVRAYPQAIEIEPTVLAARRARKLRA